MYHHTKRFRGVIFTKLYQTSETTFLNVYLWKVCFQVTNILVAIIVSINRTMCNITNVTKTSLGINGEKTNSKLFLIGTLEDLFVCKILISRHAGAIFQCLS